MPKQPAYVIPRKVSYADRPAIDKPLDEEAAHLLDNVIELDKAVIAAATAKQHCYTLTCDLFAATDDFLAATSKNKQTYGR